MLLTISCLWRYAGHITVVVALFATLPHMAYAFDSDTYTPNSVLSEGRWIKISVAKTGMHLITNSDLRSWGFNDPHKVRIYGYGCLPHGDVLSQDTYIDDLPLVASEVVERGIVFYARGPVQWSTGSNGVWTHVLDYYTTKGFYFVTEKEGENAIPSTGKPEKGLFPNTTYTERLWHETEIVNPGLTGHTFLGEDFQYNRNQAFRFKLNGIATNRQVWINCSFATRTVGGNSSLSFKVNDKTTDILSPTVIPATTNDSHHHYTLRDILFTTEAESESLSLDIALNTSATLRMARLNNISLNYYANLSLKNGGTLCFPHFASSITLSDASPETCIWDVTDPALIKKVNYKLKDTEAFWTSTESGMREYAAWNPDAAMPSPVKVAETGNQNLHSMPVPEMLIITAPEWHEQAEALASLHRTNPVSPLEVEVVDQDKIFNEFASGTPHFNAFRNFAKMLWDRGGGTSSSDSRLRYILVFGRGIYDHRRISPEVAAMRTPIVPQWQTAEGANDNNSFTSEDFLAFLRDGSGANPDTDFHCVAVGRIPVTNSAEAKAAVEKTEAYIKDSLKDDWKNRIILAADDGDSGEHLQQMEKVQSTMLRQATGTQYLYNKVYVDAFPMVDREAKEAHDRMFRLLNNGALWWWYIGHANTYSWTSEGLLTQKDLNNLNFPHQPMLYAATCDFLRWDLIEESGAEVMYFNPNGIIGAIAATRPVYIRDNANMSTSLANVILSTDKDGYTLPVGECLRHAKNALISGGGDSNKLRYVLLGDPALRVATSPNRIVIEKINGKDIQSIDQPTFRAREEVTIEGKAVDASGKTIPDFHGTLIPTLYDAEYSTTTLSHDGSDPITFEEQGDRLFIGKESIDNGTFTAKIAMPGEISHNFRPAALNLYAYSSDGKDASGVNRDIYVFGYDDSATDDTTPPTIDFFGLNSDDFAQGQKVNESPVVIARVSDNVAINISTAGVGHQMSLQLDGTKSYPDLPQYYTPGNQGAKSGSIRYTLRNLSDGPHSLRFRVWDTSNNFAEETINFTVEKGLPPKILNLYADVNPAIDHANFFIKHNHPDAMMDVTLTVFDLMGRTVWSTSCNGTTDMLNANPIHWDLTDESGRRIPRGIYVYRAEVTIDGRNYSSAAKKLAVAAQ